MAIDFLGTSVTGQNNSICFNGCPVNKVVWKALNGSCTTVFQKAPITLKTSSVYNSEYARSCAGNFPAIEVTSMNTWICLGTGLGSACVTGSKASPSAVYYRNDGHSTISIRDRSVVTNTSDNNVCLTLSNMSLNSACPAVQLSLLRKIAENYCPGQVFGVVTSDNCSFSTTMVVPPNTTCTGFTYTGTATSGSGSVTISDLSRCPSNPLYLCLYPGLGAPAQACACICVYDSSRVYGYFCASGDSFCSFGDVI